MAIESKQLLVASVVLNVICLSSIAVIFAVNSVSYTDLNKKIHEQNATILKQGIKVADQSKQIEELRNKPIIYSCKPKSCKDIKDLKPNSANGIYEIEVDGEKLEVRCEMNSASGGWTVFHNRYDGSVDFNKSWNLFEEGFGDLNGEFWLGLKNLNKLTKTSANHLRVEYTRFNSEEKFYAEYKGFRISDATENYKLSYQEGSYSGNGGDGLGGPPRDPNDHSLSAYHSDKRRMNNMEFSTFDNDNDARDNSYYGCAKKLGANWWQDCGYQHINAKYGDYGEYNYYGIRWYYTAALETIRLMFRPAV